MEFLVSDLQLLVFGRCLCVKDDIITKERKCVVRLCPHVGEMTDLVMRRSEPAVLARDICSLFSVQCSMD